MGPLERGIQMRKEQEPKLLRGRHVANKKLVYTIYFTLRVLVIVMMVAQLLRPSCFVQK